MDKNLLVLLSVVHTRRARRTELAEIAGERVIDIASAANLGDITDIIISECVSDRPGRVQSKIGSEVNELNIGQQ